MDGVFGFTRTDMLARPHTDDCWGEHARRQEQLSAAAIAQHGDSANHGVQHLSLWLAAASRARIAIRSGAAR